ncbi:DoxX family protein [Candidatus Aquiluna sp. UB-MaderosW2red]|uniref:DoxX family protein n=1 Tax=Candidatus Aquiluna sp. UB-MaderosW2red TaxID=1855377 RepID=UPI000875C69C|nr:DoxX family protein [Candidatus Aquiluna sp. UB-MaderosW2red]SCX04844.1 Uncharacterized membrane protein [Candidatus Aquiluna sp. UB-MaderosW2red]
MARETLTKRHWGSWVVIFAFTSSGILHLLNPNAFLGLLPSWAPEPLLLVYASGVAELLAALGLILRLKWAPIFTALVLSAVWPANLWFAIDTTASGDLLATIIAWARLPLQIPLIIWALRSPVKS